MGAPKNFYSSGAMKNVSRKTAKILLDSGSDSHEESYQRVVHARPTPPPAQATVIGIWLQKPHG